MLLPLFFVGNMQCAFINLYIFFRNSNFLLHFCSYFYAFSREVSSLSSISASLIYLLIVLVIPMSHALFFLLSLMFLRKNSFLALFCIGSPLPKEEYFSSYSDWISQRKSEYFWSCSDWMQREIVRASSVLLPHLYNPPPLYTHITHTSFFSSQKSSFDEQL